MLISNIIKLMSNPLTVQWDNYIKTGLEIDLHWRKATGIGLNSNDDLSNKGTWMDLSGNAKNMSLFGASYTPSSGWNNGVYTLDGIDDYGKILSVPEASAFTFEIWFNPADITASNAADGNTYKHLAWGDSEKIVVRIHPSGTPIFYVKTTVGGTGYKALQNAVLVNQLNCISVKYDGTQTYAVLNNVKETAYSLTGISPAKFINIGTTWGANNGYYKGGIYAIRWYNRYLTDAESTQNYYARV